MSVGITSLDRSLTNSTKWLNEVQEELKWPDKDRVYSATKAVLNTLRDCLMIEELHQLSAQMPMIWVGMMFDGYDPSGKPLSLNREQYIAAVNKKFGPNPVNAEEATRAVSMVLKKKLSPGEYEDVIGQLTDDLKPLFA